MEKVDRNKELGIQDEILDTVQSTVERWMGNVYMLMPAMKITANPFPGTIELHSVQQYKVSLKDPRSSVNALLPTRVDFNYIPRSPTLEVCASHKEKEGRRGVEILIDARR
ncbi:uncharacterized protein EAF01_004780 [Botrytis porri]|uniref:uncharacterized protein n=1 Tax=Botrytis porri TaxID=87229 RepID=UPI00190157EF|nr:uncharacterized protein EAF01_004780 [Botrytis porri]KAF7907193.1 hypothetical protein EAF01_004780 [Botrytis porri]